MFTQLLPNIVPTIIAQAVLNVAGAVVLEASLSFVGLGIQPPQASWGSMLKSGYDLLFQAPWYALAPAVAIFALLAALTVVGQRLQEVLGGWSVVNDVAVDVRSLCVDAVGAQNTPILRSIDFSVRRGDKVGLVGQSGSGKSMLTLSMMGLLPSSVAVASGSVTVGGTEIVGASDEELRSLRGPKVAMVYQDPMPLFEDQFSGLEVGHESLELRSGPKRLSKPATSPRSSAGESSSMM